MYVLEKKNLLVSIFLKPAKVQQPETIKSKWELNPWYPIIAYGLVVLIPATLAPSYDEMKPSHWNIHPHSQDSGYNVMSITGQEFLPSCYHKHSHHHQKPEGSMRKRKKKKWTFFCSHNAIKTYIVTFRNSFLNSLPSPRIIFGGLKHVKPNSLEFFSFYSNYSLPTQRKALQKNGIRKEGKKVPVGQLNGSWLAH